MKIKSLVLGSVAAVGFSSGAMAADLGTVLTSLDVCDALGLSGLTLSSDSNCLQISGGVEFGFVWGDFMSSHNMATNNFTGSQYTVMAPDGGAATNIDWTANVDAWLKFVGTADSSFGPAQAVIEIGYGSAYGVHNETHTSTSTTTFAINDAYVSVGDGTVISAGLKGSIANYDDDEAFGFLGLFNDEMAGGVGDNVGLGTGGMVIQVESDLGNGVTVAAALENINSGTPALDGTAIGVLAYDGDGLEGHVTVAAGGILDGTIENWSIHAGLTAELDMFKIRGAVAADNSGYWNVLGTVEAEFDMFTLALSGEAATGTGVGVQAGIGGSIGVDVTDGVTINLGARWWDNDLGAVVVGDSVTELRGELIAEVTENVTLTGSVGWIGDNSPWASHNGIVYFGGEVAWAPGGGFEAAVGAVADSNGAYQLTFDASKDFE